MTGTQKPCVLSRVCATFKGCLPDEPIKTRTADFPEISDPTFWHDLRRSFLSNVFTHFLIYYKLLMMMMIMMIMIMIFMIFTYLRIISVVCVSSRTVVVVVTCGICITLPSPIAASQISKTLPINIV